MGGDFPLTLMEKTSAMKPRQKGLQYMALKKDQSTKSLGLRAGSGRTKELTVGPKAVAAAPAPFQL